MKRMSFIFCLAAVSFALIVLMGSCQKQADSEKDTVQTKGKTKMDIHKEVFGSTPDGSVVELYSLINSNGLKARIITYGAILVSLETPDRNGRLTDITLGYDSMEGYIRNSPYFGAIVGRFANRIAKGKFTLNGAEYQLATNNGENHLHGGIKGFDKVIWKAEPLKQEGAVGVSLTYLSTNGEEGYPGNLTCLVTYTLSDGDELKISYEAQTDKATPVNLTHHSYFNLKGQGSGDILNHDLMLHADRYTPVDEGLIPTGELRSVKDSPMDFTTPKAIGARIGEVRGGYDHNFVLISGGGSLVLAAQVYEPTSGRIMEIHTTEPGIQFYTGNFLDGSITGKSGKIYKKHYGLCLETQHFPDSPNKSHFPSVILYPGEKYTQVTIYKFSTR